MARVNAAALPVAVTGAGGFLGRHICLALLQRGCKVRAVTRANSQHKLPGELRGQVETAPADVRSPQSLNKALQDVWAVVHCAALVLTRDDPEGRAEQVNLGGARNVVNACIGNGVRRLVHVSSIHAFGPMRGTVLTAASELHQGSAIPYTATKAKAHLSMLEAGRNGLLDVSILCPSGLIGPGDARPSPVGAMLLAIARQQAPCFFSGGFWWSDVRDVADAIVNAVDVRETGAVHFMAGHYAGLADLARLCSPVLGRNLARPVIPYPVVYAGLPFIELCAALVSRRLPYSRNDLSLMRDCPQAVDESSAQSRLGWAPRSLADSIRDALHWFKQQGMCS